MRARTLKPEFFTDKKMSELAPVTLLVFQALWCLADDAEGVTPCEPERIKGTMFFRNPHVTVESIRVALTELYVSGRITFWQGGDDVFARIESWPKYKKGINRPSEFRNSAQHTDFHQLRDCPYMRAHGVVSESSPPSNPRAPNPTPESQEPESVGADAPRMLAIVPGVASVVPAGPIGVADVGRPAPVARAVAGALETVRTSTTRRRAREDERKLAAACVFEYVAQRLGYPKNTRYDEKREARLLRALTENKGDVGELLAVADGALKDPWIMGKDPRSPRPYTGIETLYRDRAQVERLAALAKYDPDGPPHPFLAEIEARLAEEADHVA